MNLANLAAETIAKIKTYRFDCIVEKHEGPEDWEAFLRYYDLEFLQFNGHDVLLPVEREHHPNITLLRCIESADGESLTLFLKDTTYEDDPFFAGFLAVCDRLTELRHCLSQAGYFPSSSSRRIVVLSTLLNPKYSSRMAVSA